MVNWKNYEEYMLLSADGELNEAEQNALHEFIRLHPELKEELSAYEATRSVPDMSQVFVGKDALLKPVPASRVISLNRYVRYGAAAAILFMLLFIASRWINHSSDDQINIPEVAKQEQVTPAAPGADDTPSTDQPAIQQQPVPAVSPVHLTRSAPTSPTSGNQIKDENIERIATLLMKTLDTDSTVTIDHQPIAVADISLPTSEAQHTEQAASGFLAWLPVNEEKKEGLKNLKDNVDGKIEQAKAIKENIKETNLALRLGGKEFVVINF